MAPSLDQDRAFAEALRVAGLTLKLLADRELAGGSNGVCIPALPHPDYPGALSVPFVADLLMHAGDYVEEHTP